jgi:GNAT superfamily N-acetyltransferase
MAYRGSDITIRSLSAAEAGAHLDAFVALLRDSVDNGASVGFLPPLADDEAHAYWQEVLQEVGPQQRILLAAFRREQLVGSVQLSLAKRPNAVRRAEVQKLLVLSSERNQGLGRRLMAAVEEHARLAGRSLLILDTEQGSIAETLYRRLGFTEAGVIPAYVLGPHDSRIATVIFYKHLPAERDA